MSRSKGRIRQDSLSVINNIGTIKKPVSDVGSDRCRNTQGFLTKNVKEIFWDLNFLSEVTGCRKTQVSECTGSTV